MITESYILGSDYALHELSKDAGVKDVLKNLLLASSVAGSTVGGAIKGTGVGLSSAAPYEKMIQKATHTVKSKNGFVSVDDVLRRSNTGLQRINPTEYALHTIKDMQRKGEISKGVDASRLAKNWQSDPHYQEYNKGLRVGYLPELQVVVAGPKASKASIARAIGYNQHHADRLRSGEDLKDISKMVTLKGDQLKSEMEAWKHAKKLGLPYDKRVESASKKYYQERKDRSRTGAAAGGALGFGTSGLLLGLRELLKASKKTPKKKS